ncbi:MAG TPA: AarF/UbiB family protein [Terriglobales bacterium]|nr:AarF/UbiB family protein [Terriglobales bacterium]
MALPALIPHPVSDLSPEDLRRTLEQFVPAGLSRKKRIDAIRALLETPQGKMMRAEMGRWIVEHLVPIASLVPEEYAAWRPPVRDAMLYVVAHLSPARLAPKLLEQLELPSGARPEKRLLCLIARVPGLQKLGQVLARNRHLRPALRRSLSQLENGIRDVDAPGTRAIIRRQLGSKLERLGVQMDSRLLSEASVSAIVRFTWRNPESGQKERGVFKVLKPHIPDCFAEDMELLHDLSQYFAQHHHEYGARARLIPDTFRKVRRLLQHEVDFVREQTTLVEAGKLYHDIAGVRIPRVLAPLCTPTITALSEERGAKVTAAAARMPQWRRRQVGEQLVAALVAVPLFASGESSLFHGDPHAGNLLYDAPARDLIIVDWALRERLSRQQRRQLALLFLMVALRDPVGASTAIAALAERPVRRGSRQWEIIRNHTAHYIDQVPLTQFPSAVDAMRVLEKAAYEGIRFPGSLIMLSKVLFTLDGILHDIGCSSASMGTAMARHMARRWLTARAGFASPLTAGDWVTVQCSAILYSSRLWVKGQQTIVDRFLPGGARDEKIVSAASPRR